MKITVSVKDLHTQINIALKDYDKEYEKVLVQYNEKMQEYTKYLQREINKIAKTKALQQLRNPPYPPTWDKNNFIKSSLALKAHKRTTVEMDDREYTDMITGLQRLRVDIAGTAKMLHSINYLE